MVKSLLDDIIYVVQNRTTYIDDTDDGTNHALTPSPLDVATSTQIQTPSKMPIWNLSPVSSAPDSSSEGDLF